VTGMIQDLATDVSVLEATERRLRASEARYRAVAETALEGIWTVDPGGQTLDANHKLAEILGLSLENVYASSAPDLLGPGDNAGFLTPKPLSGGDAGPEQHELTYQHPDGFERVLRLSVRALPMDTGTPGFLVMITDISDERGAEQELRRRALYDELTGLPNRSLLTDRLNVAVARSKQAGNPVAVLLADLDQFKLINDSWGHVAGDRVLVAVAERLRGAVKATDTVARLAGDEFVIVREGASEAEAEELGAQLIKALAEPFDLAGRRSYVAASVGIAVSPPSPGEDLLRFADAAMYDAKSRGGARVQLFDLSLADEANGQLSLSNDLRDALAREELALHYQPLVELATGRVLGVEALARWDHPTRGPVSPMLFVALAAATGLAQTLDRWALARACRDLRQLRGSTNPSLRVAVNLSATHLADADLEQTVLSTLDKSGLECRDLELEITESALMDNPDFARALLERLRARGMSIAIDDFGTGYSSLGYLSRLPATTVKIDRSFIHNITEDADSLAIVASIIDLCRAMSLTTVAEGIETVEQLTLLHRLGCTAGQGFLWSPALPLAEFTQRLSTLPRGRFDVTRTPRFPLASSVGETPQATESVAASSQEGQPERMQGSGTADARGPLVWGASFAAALRAGRLSSRELEIVTRLARGKRVPAIAAELFLTQGTVRNQLSSVYRKLGLRSQQELLDVIHSGSPAKSSRAAHP
jgi:diguanylate cyclase (GGDEF)-like protein/PAS domain S-box-containing protein